MKIRSTLKKKEKKNKGGLLGGAGYLLGSAAAGMGSVGEGIIDLGLALGADLTGNHKFAEYVFKDNVVGDWHEDLTEDYNPDDVIKFGGDVAHGLGQSSWFLLSLIPGAQWLGPTVFGAGMVGQGVSGAAEVTGDVGIKEAAYGVTTAALETGLEVALGGMGKVVKTGVGAAAKATGKQTLKSIVSSATRKGLGSKLFSAAAGEFAEEFISEYADTFLQKMYQIDPNKEYSLKDALYAGAVGAVSGGISGGSAAVIDTTVNQHRGARIIAKGNAQTLVNTANLVADKLASAGSDFKNAPEWVTKLRGEVDAYNKLVEKGQGDSLSAQTILGEMQASLFFAETQAIHSGIREGIKNASENDRAAMAEYINLSVDKSKRKKDYTAEDIAKDTDDVATQLATLNMAGSNFFNYDAAIADMERESAIENKIATEREAATARAAEEAQGAESGMQGEPLSSTPQAAPSGAAEGGAAVVDEAIGAEDTQMGAAASATGAAEAQEVLAAAPGVSGAAVATEGEVKADLTPRMPRIRSTLKTVSKGASAPGGALVEGEGTKYSVAVKKKAVAKQRENAAREERRAAKRAQETQEAREGTEDRKIAKDGTEAKDDGKVTQKSSDRKSESGEIKISEPKESMTDAQRKEKARKRAEQWVEWEKKSAPSAKELNAAREYVKGFDNIENTRRLAIVRMIRSAEGKVDKKTLKGVANLIAAMPKADVEIRFAEGLGDLGGFYAPKVGGKALIVIDSSTNFKKTIQGTIAHELVHHLEKKAGYKAFAKYVMSRVKPEKKAEVEEAYTEFYVDKYISDAEKLGLSGSELKAYVDEKISSEEFKALIESEVVAKYTGEALNNEKLLKKYADKDKKFIAKVGEWLFDKVTNLKKDKDVNSEVVEIAEEMAFRVSVLAQGTKTEGESTGETKYAFDGIPEQIAEWEKPITLHDVETLRSIGRKSINSFTSEEIEKAQKWAYKFYKELGTKSPFFRAWFGDWRAHDVKNPSETIDIPQGVNINIANRYVKNADTQWKIQITEDLFGDSLHYANKDRLYIERLLSHIDEVISKAIYLDSSIVDKNKGNKKGSSQFMHYLYAVVEYQGAPFLAKIGVEEYNAGTSERAYNVQRIKMSTLSRAQYSQLKTAYRGKYASSVDAISIADLYDLVKTYDEKFSPAPEVSKYVLNEDGTPKVLYHGTNAEYYSINNNTEYGLPFFATTDVESAKTFGKRQLSLYGRAEKPLVLDAHRKGIHEALYSYKGKRIHFNELLRLSRKDGYDSVIVRNAFDSADGSGNVSDVYAFFYPEKQIKSATENIGTFDKDNPDIRYDLVGKKGKRANKQDDSVLNENGEVKDEYFAAAVMRSYENTARSAQNTAEAYKEANKRITDKLAESERKYKQLVAEGLKQHKFDFVEIENLRSEMRELGYNFEAERRRNERLLEQLKKQQDMLKETKQENRELEKQIREAEFIQQINTREAASIAKKIAKQRADFGKVYNANEIKQQVKEIVEGGFIGQFLEGKYRPELSAKTRNGIAEYIAMQLNLIGSGEGKGAEGLAFAAANDITKRITFEDSESGEVLYLDKIVDEEGVRGFREKLESELITMFQNVGTVNPFAEMQRKFAILKQKYLDDNKKAREEKEWGAELPKTYQAALKIRRMADQKKGGFSDSVQGVLEELRRIVDESGHMHYGRIDAAMHKVSDFLAEEDLRLKSERGQLSEESKTIGDSMAWNVDPALREQVEMFLRLRAGREGQSLTAEEMKLVGNVLRGMKVSIERYNKEYINGHWVDIDKAAADEVRDVISFKKMQKDKEYKTKVGKWLESTVGKKANHLYFYKILSPETVIGALEGYGKGGIMQSMYHSIRDAQSKANTMATRMLKPFDEFLNDKENRWEGTGADAEGGVKGWKYSYRDKLNVKQLSVFGSKITLGEAINLYMLTKREEARAGLRESGYIVFDEDGTSREIKIEDVDRARDFIANQFDEADLKFVKMAEDFFNVTASKIKYDADIKIFGYSNNGEGYYVPMVRDRYSHVKGVTDARFSIGETVTLYSPSFTKNLVANANGLEGTNIMLLIDRHARGLADYSELYLPLKAFDRIYNRGVATNEGVTSIREQLNNGIWGGTERYFKDLFEDIQHQTDVRDNVVDEIVGQLRSGWVNSVLGANIKVIATQTTSLGAATQMIEPKYITQASRLITPGLKVGEIRERAYKYSNVIEARAFDMGALKAQGNVDKINRIGELSGWGIGWMDERVTLAIFHAAELKVEAQGGGAVGTEANAIAAAKIADEAIYATQSMSDATEKSALQRSKSEIGKLFSMFTSDTVKNLSHFYGNLMKYKTHKERADAGDAAYAEMLKQDKAELLRSTRTLAITGIMLGLITQAFKYLYAKEEDEPEDKAKDLAIDLVSSTLNILPIVSDIVDKLFLDYDISMNVLDVANDTIESVSNGFDTVGKAMSGEYVSADKAAGTAIDITMSGAQVFGIPVKPVERTITGLFRRFAPSAIYGYDAMFSNPSYTADLKKAVESGDEALAEHVLSELYKSEVNGTYTSTELEEVVRLYSLTDEEGKHYSVLPQKIGTEVNGVKLTSAQRKQFTKIYAQASGEVNKLISSSYYATLDDEQRAKAIKNVYAMYYGRAANEIVGKEMTSAVAYSYLTSNYAALFASQAYKGGLEEQKDASGNKITVKDQFVDYAANLGLSAEDLLVISYANGVRDKATRAAFLQYLNSLSLTAEIKAQIAERLGFELKDGVIVEKTEQ